MDDHDFVLKRMVTMEDTSISCAAHFSDKTWKSMEKIFFFTVCIAWRSGSGFAAPPFLSFSLTLAGAVDIPAGPLAFDASGLSSKTELLCAGLYSLATCIIGCRWFSLDRTGVLATIDFGFTFHFVLLYTELASPGVSTTNFWFSLCAAGGCFTAGLIFSGYLQLWLCSVPNAGDWSHVW